MNAARNSYSSFPNMTVATARAVVVVLFAAVCVAPVLAHSKGKEPKTAKKCDVDHRHFTEDCLPSAPGTPKICASQWKQAEKDAGFKRSDLVYEGTTAWNCHGRTFDDRKSWISLAEPYLNCDAPFCPAKPKEGDAIIWWYLKSDPKPPGVKAGMTKHSATIVGPWKGLDTLVMSKYGAMGQYKHKLSNCVKAYGKNYAVTNFGAGTRISKQSVLEPGEEKVDVSDSSSNLADRLLAEREQTPWYQDVLESEAVYREARAAHMAIIGALRPETVDALSYLTEDAVRVGPLVEDLRRPDHYAILGMYNFPEPELLSGMVAAQELADIAVRRPDLRPFVIESLRGLVFDGVVADEVRATGIAALNKILTPDERASLRNDVESAMPDVFMHPTYSSFFAERVAREDRVLEREP